MIRVSGRHPGLVLLGLAPPAGRLLEGRRGLGHLAPDQVRATVHGHERVRRRVWPARRPAPSDAEAPASPSRPRSARSTAEAKSGVGKAVASAWSPTPRVYRERTARGDRTGGRARASRDGQAPGRLHSRTASQPRRPAIWATRTEPARARRTRQPKSYGFLHVWRKQADGSWRDPRRRHALTGDTPLFLANSDGSAHGPVNRARFFPMSERFAGATARRLDRAVACRGGSIRVCKKKGSVPC